MNCRRDNSHWNNREKTSSASGKSSSNAAKKGNTERGQKELRGRRCRANWVFVGRGGGGCRGRGNTTLEDLGANVCATL